MSTPISTIPQQPVPHSNVAPEINSMPVKTIVTEKPVVVQETIHPVEKVQVQPVIYREREQLEVHQVTQKMHQTQILSPKIERRMAQPQYAPVDSARAAELDQIRAQAMAREDVENVEVIEEDGVTRIRVIKRPILQENARRTIIEEVQPVIIRDTLTEQQRTIDASLPVFEKIIMVPMRFRFRGQVDFASFTVDQPFDAPVGPVMSIEELYRLQSMATVSNGGFVQVANQNVTLNQTQTQVQREVYHPAGLSGLTTSVTAVPQGGIHSTQVYPH